MDYARLREIIPAIDSDASGRRIAVIGAGPAGLSCAGELTRHGHAVTVFEKRPLPGGLSTYGIIGLREPLDIALEEARMIESMGVTILSDRELGVSLDVAELRRDFDAIVLSTGLGRSPFVGIDGEHSIVDGLDFIEASKTAPDRLQIGRNVLVIGAGNTAVDCATIARRLGADKVTIVYRRSESEMTCYEHEYRFARKEGIDFRFLSQPSRVVMESGRLVGLECLRVELGAPDRSGRPSPTTVAGTEFVLDADQIIKAVGQLKPPLAELLGLKTASGFICVDSDFETSSTGVYAIGDCIRLWGAASTVMAVQDGKLAAAAISRKLLAESAATEIR